MKKIFTIVPFLVVAILVGVTVSYAGSLTPPGPVANTMYTLDDIYTKLTTNANATLGSGTIPATPGSPSATFHTLTQLYTAIPTIDATKVLTGTTYLGVAGTASAGGLPKTNQTTCWNTDGSPQIPCLDGTNVDGGQDGFYLKGLPASGAHFIDNNNNTITDNATGLMWKKCTEGQTDTDCSGDSASTLDWTTALSTCEADTTASHSDWRLPNRNELLSIVSLATVNPAIDTDFFPNTQSDIYWSSSTYQYPGYEYIAWFVDFFKGFMDASDKTSGFYVRCVR